MFNQKDTNQILQRGATVRGVEEQIEHFKKGFPWMKIVGPATPHRGIRVLTEAEADAAIRYYEGAEIAGKCKFVPASGAASRMFKDIFAGLATLEKGEDLPADAAGAKLAAQIDKFAFYTEELFGTKEDTAAYRKSVLSKVLTDEGLGYGAKPKGVIKFHRYEGGEVRTAIAEHLVEAATYMRNADGTCNLVVTISPEHQPLFEAALAEVQPVFEARYGVKYNVTFTFQDKATDTIAVDAKNKPFRTDDDALLFRPAGHGALIYNLNKVDAELVSIKNIDNVAHEKLLGTTARYKKVLMGEALKVRDRIFGYLRRLDAEPTVQLCNEIENFLDQGRRHLAPDSRKRPDQQGGRRCGAGDGPCHALQSRGSRVLPPGLQGRQVQPPGTCGSGSRLHQLQELPGPRTQGPRAPGPVERRDERLEHPLRGSAPRDLQSREGGPGSSPPGASSLKIVRFCFEIIIIRRNFANNL